MVLDINEAVRLGEQYRGVRGPPPAPILYNEWGRLEAIIIESHHRS